MVYRGVESGSVEAVFKAATPEAAARPYTTGLEGSALGGGGSALAAGHGACMATSSELWLYFRATSLACRHGEMS